ncbi:clostripain-related cysteine peptidase [Chitinophagaceae bacterium LB-8]|uniref:Clostripain-related cysteine peptidase n=1 Tax=Paraflavisolibacter caeni TaxID=2982496 RepID=A0A9X2XWK8_9BACT|nr:clostripain-related cysteine peptidase [Paraflavisolibacter caeni]MCU7549842.1 clostripain-related cysteine peptidase [Paraflavisolibacter caeni]
MSHQGKKWVIVFLIYADFRIDKTFPMNEEMKIELDLMLREILTTPINTGNARLYVILNGIKYKVQESQGVQIENRTLLYEIINPERKSINQFGCFQIIENIVYEPGKPNPNNVQNPEKLKRILEKIKVMEKEEVVLITWDHGSAFGIFREEISKPPTTIRKPIYQELDNYPYLKAFWERAMEERSFSDTINKERENRGDIIIQSGYDLFKLSLKEDTQNIFANLLYNIEIDNFIEVKKNEMEPSKLVFNKEKYFRSNGLERHDFNIEEMNQEFLLEENVTEILKNDELAESLSDWLGNKKVGVLLMMNCWMMNLHTMYSLRKSVQCLIAPQGNIAIPGYNYRGILRYLYKPLSPFRTNQALAIKCVKTCENKYAKKREEKIHKKLTQVHEKIDSWKIIAIDLQKEQDEQFLFDKQITLLKCIVESLISEINSASEFKYMFKYIRSVSFDYTSGKSRMIDIINWLLSIRHSDLNSFPSKLTATIKHEIMKLKNITVGDMNNLPIVLAKSKGKSIFNNGSASIRLEPTGYSIFFPEKKIDNDPNLIHNIRSDLFLTEFLTNWNTFLNNIDSGI